MPGHEVADPVPELRDSNLYASDEDLTTGARHWQLEWLKETCCAPALGSTSNASALQQEMLGRAWLA